jgi:hypothetical protein
VQTLDYLVPVVDPAWSHLSVCYHILAVLLCTFPTAEFINLPFVVKLLNMAQMPDARERTAIVTFVKLYWEVRPTERPQLTRALENQFSLVRHAPLPPWTSAALLLIARHAVTLATADDAPTFVAMTVNAILPLVYSQHLVLFHSELKGYLTEFHRVWPEFRVLSLWQIQQSVSLMRASISQYFTDLVMSIAVQLERRLFIVMANSFFSWLTELLRSPNRYVSFTILTFFTREDNEGFIRQNLSAVIHRCYEAIADLGQNHWHDDVRSKAVSVTNLLAHWSPNEVGQAVKAKKALETGKKKPADGKGRSKRGWRTVLAGIDWEEMEITEADVSETIGTLLNLEEGDRRQARFMPGPGDSAAKDLYKEMQAKLATGRRFGRPARDSLTLDETPS